jgi:hypothetical protein
LVRVPSSGSRKRASAARPPASAASMATRESSSWEMRDTREDKPRGRSSVNETPLVASCGRTRGVGAAGSAVDSGCDPGTPFGQCWGAKQSGQHLPGRRRSWAVASTRRPTLRQAREELPLAPARAERPPAVARPGVRQRRPAEVAARAALARRRAGRPAPGRRPVGAARDEGLPAPPAAVRPRPAVPAEAERRRVGPPEGRRVGPAPWGSLVHSRRTPAARVPMR